MISYYPLLPLLLTLNKEYNINNTQLIYCFISVGEPGIFRIILFST